jgi:hypothetical protein
VIGVCRVVSADFTSKLDLVAAANLSISAGWTDCFPGVDTPIPEARPAIPYFITTSNPNSHLIHHLLYPTKFCEGYGFRASVESFAYRIRVADVDLPPARLQLRISEWFVFLPSMDRVEISFRDRHPGVQPCPATEAPYPVPS